LDNIRKLDSSEMKNLKLSIESTTKVSNLSISNFKSNEKEKEKEKENCLITK